MGRPSPLSGLAGARPAIPMAAAAIGCWDRLTPPWLIVTTPPPAIRRIGKINRMNSTLICSSEGAYRQINGPMTTNSDVVVEKEMPKASMWLPYLRCRVVTLDAIAGRAHGSGPRGDHPLPRRAGPACGNPGIRRWPEGANRFMTRACPSRERVPSPPYKDRFRGHTRTRKLPWFPPAFDGRITTVCRFTLTRTSNLACCRRSSETQSSRERSSNNSSKSENGTRVFPEETGNLCNRLSKVVDRLQRKSASRSRNTLGPFDVPQRLDEALPPQPRL